MCFFPSSTAATPTLPDEPAQANAPDAGAVKDSKSRRVEDTMRSTASTILTSGSGVDTFAPTSKKTLLGQ